MTSKQHPPTTEAASLESLLREAASHKMTPEERREQRVSFVWGMLPHTSTLTKDDVRRKLEEIDE